MPEKKLTSQQAESLKWLYRRLTEPLIRELQQIKEPKKKIIFGGNKPFSVNDIIEHIRNMTPIGIKYAEMFLGGILKHSTLPMFGEKEKKF